MNKIFIILLVPLVLLIGCDIAKQNEEDQPLYDLANTDYYYEANNQSINSGHKKMKEGNYKDATEYYTKAIEELPNYAYAYGFRAWAKMETGDLEGALVDVNKAIEMKDDAHDFYLWRSQIYREMGRVEEANIDDIKWKELKKKLIQEDLENI